MVDDQPFLPACATAGGPLHFSRRQKVSSPFPVLWPPLHIADERRFLARNAPAGVLFSFPRHEKLSPPSALTGLPLRPAHDLALLFPPTFAWNASLLPQHQKFLVRLTPAGPPLAFPISQNCPAALGAALCNLPCLPLFRTPQAPVTTAIAPGIAASSPHRGVPVAPFQTRMAAGDHQSGGPAPSCRLCLIACNSRKFTFRPMPSAPPVPEEGFSGDR